MGNHICYMQGKQHNFENRKKKLRIGGSQCPKINVNYNIKYQYNNYVQNNQFHTDRQEQHIDGSQFDFGQVNKLLVMEENLMKNGLISKDQLQHLISEYQKIVEDLDRYNSPIKNYFIQKMQNILSQEAIKKQEMLLSQNTELKSGQNSFLAQIEQKIESRQMKKIYERRISQGEHARKQSLHFTLKLAQQTPQKDDKQLILEILDKHEQHADQIDQELQRQDEEQMTKFKYRLFNRKMKRIVI